LTVEQAEDVSSAAIALSLRCEGNSQDLHSLAIRLTFKICPPSPPTCWGRGDGGEGADARNGLDERIPNPGYDPMRPSGERVEPRKLTVEQAADVSSAAIALPLSCHCNRDRHQPLPFTWRLCVFARNHRARNPRPKPARHSPSPLFVLSASFVVNPTRVIRAPISPWTDKILRPASSRQPGFQTPDQSMLRSTVGRIPPLR
jgi:hypothetical protein